MGGEGATHHITEALGDRVVPRVNQVHFGALHGHRAPRRNGGGHFQGSLQQRLLVGKNPATGERGAAGGYGHPEGVPVALGTAPGMGSHPGGAGGGGMLGLQYLTKPELCASGAIILRAVKASSLTRLQKVGGVVG